MNINDAEFFKKLRSTFKIEAHDHIRTISLSLVELEKKLGKEETKTIVEIIHREFHSLKGAARAVNIKEIETICHMLENIFSKVKKEKLILNPDMFDVLNTAVDIIEDILCLEEGTIKPIEDIMDKLTDIELGEFSNKGITKVEEREKYEELKMTLHEPKGIENVSPSDIVIKTKMETEELKLEAVRKESVKEVKIPEDNIWDVMRVSKTKLDSLLIQGEEMIYAKLSTVERAKEINEIKLLLDMWKKEKKESYIETIENKVEDLLKASENDAKTIETMIDSFMDGIKDVMLMPFSSIVEMFPKMIRDLGRHLEKEVDFICNGTDIEIDRRILEEIKDPFMHLIRNSIDHGIEKGEVREKFNKPRKGTISLNISQVSSDKVKIEVTDDGAGIDIENLKRKAIKNKILNLEQANAMEDESAKMLIFNSGLSTSDIITDISGRGLGLAIVYEKVQKLDGNISVSTKKQEGTTFVITLPITISTNRGIIVKEAGQTFVVPTVKVEKVTRIRKDEVQIMENRATILLDDQVIPIVKLKDILELEDRKIDNSLNDIISILVLNDMERKIAFSVDQIIIEQEVLVKRFNKQLKRVKNISGATILGSGEVAPILSVQDLIKTAFKNGTKSLNIINDIKKEGNESKHILIVEDSITSRTLLKNILEHSGYCVKTAVNGMRGWEMVKSERFDLVITDVEMPEMNGFELTSKIRSDSEVGEIPVILVTSLESREDKERGIDVGASAYIVKSDFQQSNLFEVIERLI